MSRAYRIRQTVRVQDTLSRDLSASDEICTTLEVLEILPADEMGSLLRDALQARGFQEEEGKMIRRQEGLTVAVDPENGEVSIRIEGTAHVDLSAIQEGQVFNDAKEHERAKVQANLREAVHKVLECQAKEQGEHLQRKLSAELEGRLGDLSAELDRVVNQATREALKIKAGGLGQIKEMTEDPESGSLTIAIEI